MIYEYRTYHAVPGRLPELLARFRDHTLRIFARHGIESLGYWTSATPGCEHRLMYLVRFADEAAQAAAWPAFRADPEWQAVRSASEGNGPLLERYEAVLLQPTDFSPLR